jgi:DMSO/TMAO reductase YedYZ molybdopterin-dependent catalytic subunit
MRRSRYGFPTRLWAGLDRHRPRWWPHGWRSPLRGPWLTAVLGLVLLVTLPLVIITGLLSYIAYGPQFGQAAPGQVGWLHLPYFDWPTRPAWLYQLTQGLHVGLGLVLVPVILAKLWSVLPKLFVWPPARSLAQVLERLSLVLLVGGILFEIATGVLNIQYDYIFGFSFYTAHYLVAWVFTAAFVFHVGLKLPRMLRALRHKTAGEPDELTAPDPAEPTISRRGALLLVGGGAALIAVLTVGQSLGGPARRLAVLLPRGGADDFPINRTAAAAGIRAADTGAGWRLALRGGPRLLALDRAALLALPQHQATLPIACVEGWATTRTWSGVRLRDLARLAGVPEPGSARVESLELTGGYRRATLQRNQVLDPDALLALLVDGDDLSLDHGYPARVIVPALPGVHNTKWVRAIQFRHA